MKKKIAIVGSVGFPAKYGGFETLVEQLYFHINKDFDLTVFCSSLSYSKNEERENFSNLTRVFIPTNANGPGSITYDIKSLLFAAKTNDIVLLLGGSASFILPLYKLFYPKVKIIFHPDGAEWKRKKWNAFAKLFLYSSIKIGTWFADKIILDNRQLTKYHKKVLHKSEFIPYGGDQFSIPNSKKRKYWLTIARAEKENNLELIAEAFKNINTENWVLISNWKDTPHGLSLNKTYCNNTNITFINASYNKRVLEKYYSESKGYIHGHSNGGTNPTLVTAMWTDRPLFCHENCFNIETTKRKATYFANSEQLTNLIRQNSKNENKTMLDFAKKRYSWEQICGEYLELFKNI